MLDAATRPKFDIVPWNTSFETSIAIIDEQHHQLVTLINTLAHEYVHGAELGEVKRILDALIDYAAYHFKAEEALWAKVLANDNSFKKHLKTHKGFVDKVRAMQAKLKKDDKLNTIDDLLSFLTGWLAHHILYEDKLFSLVYLQVREGTDLNLAKLQAQESITGQTSGLIQGVLSMYKELSSRTLALEREAYSRQVAEQALLNQEQHWCSVLGASRDNLWDWEFSAADELDNNQPLAPDLVFQKGLTIHPEDWPGLRQDFLNHLLGQSDIFSHQHRVIDTDGNERWVQSRGKIIELDSAGRPKRMVGTQTDITERKTAELTLQRERDIRTLISEFAADFMASSSENFDAAINRALQRSGEYMQAHRTYVFLVSADGQRMNNTHEWCASGIEPEIENLQGIPSSALPWWWSQFRDVGYVLVPRLSDMPPEAKNEYKILESQGIRSVCVYPLHIGKELVGFMGNDSVAEERYWGIEVIEFLSLMSDLLGIALGHRQLHQKRAQAISHLERAEKQANLGHWHIDYTLHQSVWSQEMFRIFECDTASFIPNLASYLKLVHPDDRIPLYNAYEQAKASLSELHLEHRLLLNENKVKHLEVRGRFNFNSEGQLTLAEGTVQDVTERVQHRNALHRLAFQDSLTNLPNRRSIEDTLLYEMDYCERHKKHFVLALLDLDNFREVNDQQGVAIGDASLKTLALRIRQLFTNTAIIARVGGDEFVVLFTRLTAEDNCFKQLKQLLAVISKPITIDGISLALTASIGVTEYPQPRLVAAEQLMRQAQQALFQAKMLGKGHFYTYDFGSEQHARELIDHLEQVRKALHANEFVLYYQPKVYMKTGVVFGVEALIRWQKSTGEIVPPGSFLPALYNNTLEIELGDWVIATVLAQMRQWQQVGLEIQVSINVSSLQLFDPAFVEKLSKDLKDYPDIQPSLLQLEVLESSMLNDLVAVSEIIQQSRKLGVSFALDDFGTGYSSLAYLKHLPASVLKIDQSFVQEMMKSTDDLSIISGVIGMANAFGMQVIAEGVESIEQGNLLLRLGCEQGQGYGIAKPMPADDLPNWIKHWKAAPTWIGQESSSAQNLPLIYAEVEHHSWMLEIEEWLGGKSDKLPTLDHHQCKVGLWIDKEVRNPNGLDSKFSYLVNLHNYLHKLVVKVVAMQTEGQLEAVKLALPKMQQQHHLFLTELRELIG